MIEILLLATVRVTFLVVVGAVAAALARKRSAAFRSAIWTAVALVAIALPLLPRPAISVTVPPAVVQRWAAPAKAIPESEKDAPAVLSTARAASAPSFQPIDLVSIVFFIGLSFTGAGSTISLLGARRLLAASGPATEAIVDVSERISSEYGLRRTPDVRIDQGQTMPFTLGAYRPRIVLPCDAATWNETKLEAILRHEIAHIERMDWLMLLAARVTCILYWYHPLVWWAAAKLRLEAEQAADDMVLRGHSHPADYADELLAWTSHRSLPSATLPMARRSGLSQRLRRVLDRAVDRRSASWRAKGSIIVAALGATALVPVLRAEPLVTKPLLDKLQHSPQATTGPSEFTFPDGTKLQVKRAATWSRESGYQAWTLSGHPLRVENPEELLSAKNQTVYAGSKSKRWVTLYYRLQDPKPEPSLQPMCNFYADGYSFRYSSTLHYKEGKGRYCSAFLVPAGEKLRDISIEIAPGRLQLYGQEAIGKGTRMQPLVLKSAPRGLGETASVENRTIPLQFVKFVKPKDSTEWSWGFEAIWSDGKTNSFMEWTQDDESILIGFAKRPGKKIVALRAKRRRVYKAIIRNVHLLPDANQKSH